MSNLFTAKDFLKALVEGSLVEPIIRVGMVKPDPDDKEAFLFSESSACGRCLKIPAEAVESVEFLGTARCQDHEHPLVRLHLKEPPKDNAIARVFAELARGSRPRPKRSVLSRALSAAPTGAIFNGERLEQECWYVNHNGQISICCDDGNGNVTCGGIG